MIEVRINQQLTSIQEGTSVEDVVNNYVSGSKAGIAVAVNNEVIPRNEWVHKKIAPNDDILIIKATRGG